MPTQHLVLVPGFFGFVNFGRLVYFAHVAEELERELLARGADLRVHRVRTHPVASLRQRARDLHAAVAALPDDGPVHIVGHSTGGLDARLLVSPGVDLGLARDEVERAARRVRTVTSICTPHRGSPLAGHLAGIIGEPLLRTLSIMTALALRRGRVPTHLALRLARALVGERLLPNTPVHLVLETLEHEAAATLREDCGTMEDQLSIADFMAEVRAVPHLIPQLMPQALDLFNAGIRDREGVRYGCVIARCPAPGLRSQLRLGGGIYEHATHLFYQWLYLRTAPLAAEFEVELGRDHIEAMRASWGEVASPRDNDGMVPTASQVHGRIVHAATADHLDVIGHLHEPHHQPPHHDWISSGSGFDRPRFDALWRDVVAAILAE
ncbi:MAG: triacylglycerol lipase [Enhygromyxa sp.]